MTITQERADQQQLEEHANDLPQLTHSVILQNIIEHVCWHGDISREWLEQEFASQLKRKGLK